MRQLVAQLAAAAAIGALSPLATMATIAVLSAPRRPLVNALMLLLGWTIVLVALGGGMIVLLEGSSAARGATRAVLNLVLGVVLMSFGLRRAIGGAHPLAKAVAGEIEARPQTPGWMQALDALTPAKALGVGAVLLLASPADVAVFLSAAQGLSGNEVAAEARWLVLIALIACIDLCMLVPIAVYLGGPARAHELLARLRGWLLAHQARLTTWMLLGFGALLVVAGMTRLA